MELSIYRKIAKTSYGSALITGTGDGVYTKDRKINHEETLHLTNGLHCIHRYTEGDKNGL